MKSFVLRWFWKGRQKWLIFLSVTFFLFWVASYFIVYSGASSLCTGEDDACYDLWLHTIGKPFYWGSFLRVAAVMPLLILFCSKLIFRVWVLFSIIAVPCAIYATLTTPYYVSFLNNQGVNGMWGAMYLFGTVAIIVVVGLGEFLYTRFYKKA